MIELFIAFGAGFISFLSPCVLPLVPGYISFVSGRSLNQLLESKKIEPEVGKVIVFISNKMKHGVEEVRGGRFTYISWWRNSNDF